MNVTVLPSPTKSKSDLKDYRHIKLENGLHAFLISDVQEAEQMMEGNEGDLSDMDADDGVGSEGSDDSSGSDEEMLVEEIGTDSKKLSGRKKQAAAALCVGVGSFSDPDNIPGLAHFLEHMVFMGSSKFPDENHFDMFIKRHGGSDNANTDCERTVFHFEINPVYLKEALNIWAQFFISPLLKADSIDREVLAVDSEFTISSVNDRCRREQLLGSLCKAGHPVGKFLWGNERSLKLTPSSNGIDVYNALHCFHEKYYSADMMTLAVQSTEDLDTLQNWVVEIFKDVPHNSRTKRVTFQPDIPYPHEKQKPFLLYNVVPVEDVQELHLTWFLPPQHQHYKVKPLQYVTWLMGHEGKGSLLWLLKKQCLALSLCAEAETGGLTDNSLYSTFSIEVSLTDKGCEQCFMVMDYVFQYLLMLRKKGASERVFREIQQIEDIEFAFKEENVSAINVEESCEHMQLYPPKDVLTGPSLLKKYDVDIIQNVLDALLPNKCLSFFYDRKMKRDSSKAQNEPWFGSEFHVSEIDDTWKEQWSNVDNLTIHPDLDLPTPNPFIAEDFTLVTSKDEADFSDVHHLRTSKAGHHLWFKLDKKFALPRAYIRMHLINPIACQSAEMSAYLDLMIRILEHNMGEVVYHANAASLVYSLSATSRGGLLLRISGFNHKLLLLLSTMLEYFVGFATSDDVFEEHKHYLLKDYHNRAINPRTICKDLRLSILEKLKFSILDKYSASQRLSKDGLMKFVAQYKSSLHVETLVQGNYSREEAIRVFENSLSVVDCPVLPESAVPVERVIKLPTKPHFIKAKSLNKEDENSMVIVYLQLGPGDMRKSVYTQLLGLIMEEPCFDILRTKKQLGYVVYAQDHNTSGILGISVGVQTQNSKFSVETAATEIINFLTVDFAELLNKMLPEDFAAQVSSLITLKMNDDTHLGEEVDRNWDEILLQDYNFRRLEQEVEHLKAVTFTAFKKFYRQACILNKQVLVLQVRGNSDKLDGKEPDAAQTPKSNGVSSSPFATRLEMLDPENFNYKATHIKNIPNFIQSAAYFPVSHVLNRL